MNLNSFMPVKLVTGAGCVRASAKALAAIGRIKSGMRIIVDIDREMPDCSENEIRRRRKNFYLRNGYFETEVRYCWQEEYYEILVSGGKLSREDFGNFSFNIDDYPHSGFYSSDGGKSLCSKTFSTKFRKGCKIDDMGNIKAV